MPLKKPKPADCDLCYKRIVEGKEKALNCEGGCGLWFHRYCVGVSVSHFKELSSSPDQFVCYICYQRSQLVLTKQLQSEVAHLKGEINKLSEQITKLSTASSERPTAASQPSTNNTSADNNVPTYAAASLKQINNSVNPTTITCMHAQLSNKAPGASTKHSNTVNKKFNVVMYCLNECPKGSPIYEHISKDTNLVCKAVKSICPNMSDYDISDCSRIGKYSEQRTRPLILKFAGSCDVATVLSNRHKNLISKSYFPNVYYVKPFMPVAERKTESECCNKILHATSPILCGIT